MIGLRDLEHHGFGKRKMACRACRERKVKCDGEQPACGECCRTAEDCVYIPTFRPSKAELEQKLEAMQKRLERTEELLRKSQQSNPSIAEYGSTPPLTAPAHGFGSFGDGTFLPMADQFELGRFQHPNRSSFGDLHGQYNFNSLQGVSNPTPNTAPSLAAPRVSSAPAPDPSQEHQETYLPSLQQLRESRRSSASLGGDQPSTPEQSCHGKETGETCPKLVAELKTLLTTIFTTHAEIAGISSAVAEYLAWIRREPQSPATLGRVAWVLECRAHEIHDMAEKQHLAAWRAMVKNLESHDHATAPWLQLEEELLQKAAEARVIFEAKYDASMALYEQRLTSTNTSVEWPAPLSPPYGRNTGNDTT